MHQRAPLNAGERLGINFLRVTFLAHNKPAPRAAQGLVRGCGDEIRVFDGAGMQPRGDHAGDVGNVGQHQRANLTGDFAHAGEVDDARIGARADSDHFGAMFMSQPGKLVIVNDFILFANAVVDDFKKFAGEIRLVAVR